MKEAFHVATTGRCGPVLVDVPRDVQEAELDFRYPDERRPARLAAAGEGAPAARSARPPACSPQAEKPVLYVGGGTLNGDACDELRELGRGRPAAGDHDADGQERVPGDARAALRLAGDARAEVVEPRHEHLRRPRRGRRALRRPRDREALGLRARARPSIHLDIDAAEISKLREADVPVVGPLKQALAELAREVARHRHEGAPPPDAWVRRIADWREEFPLRYGARRRLHEAAVGDPAAAGADRRRGRDRRRRASASTRCGRCSTSSPSGPAPSSRRAGSGRWATGSRPRSAPRRRAPRRRSSASTATAASR